MTIDNVQKRRKENTTFDVENQTSFHLRGSLLSVGESVGGIKMETTSLKKGRSGTSRTSGNNTKNLKTLVVCGGGGVVCVVCVVCVWCV